MAAGLAVLSYFVTTLLPVVEELQYVAKLTPWYLYSGAEALYEGIDPVLLTLAIGVPMILLALWIMESSGGLWWLYVWLAWMSFSLIMFWAYPAIIAPLFNKFSPLENETLKSRIQALLDKLRAAYLEFSDTEV